MINVVTFPGLGLEFTVNRVAFTVFGLNIYWYGVVIAAGLLLGMLFAFANAKRFGIDSDRMVDVILLSTVMAVVCGRAYYVAFAPFKYASLWDMINLRDGGMAIYGAVLGAFGFGWLFCKWRKVPPLPMFDLASMGFLIGQCLGRWGNYFNQEAFGTNTSLPWGMYSQNTHQYLAMQQQTLAAAGMVVDPSMPVHPTFLYESLWCLVGFIALAIYMKNRRFNGEISLLYVLWYGLGRGWIEGLRTDSLMTGDLRTSQLLAIASALAALVALVILRRKYRGRPTVEQAMAAAAAEVPQESEKAENTNGIDTAEVTQNKEGAEPAEQTDPQDRPQNP